MCKQCGGTQFILSHPANDCEGKNRMTMVRCSCAAITTAEDCIDNRSAPPPIDAPIFDKICWVMDLKTS